MIYINCINVEGKESGNIKGATRIPSPLPAGCAISTPKISKSYEWESKLGNKDFALISQFF
jgi:hypothetical protein